MRTLLSVLLLGGLALIACDDEPFDIEDDDLLVVRAFIYAGEPVQAVELTRTIALDSEEDPEPVSDAEVALWKGGVVYPLIPTPASAGFYHYPGSDLTIETGDAFKLEIDYGGQVVTAETVVPAPPEGMGLSSDVMEIPDLLGGVGGFGGGRGGLLADPLVVRWSNPDRSYFFLTVDNLEDDPEILPTTELFVNRPVRFTSQPVTSDSMYVNVLTLTHFGAHEVTLYHVNSEYADLYEGRTQDTRDLNEPPSNINGGLGVFSAFAGSKAYFVAVKEEG